MTRSIDLNADLGEGSPHDAALMALASSVNIACGGHAGDAGSIRSAIARAVAAGCAIGAHPGYEDPGHFGRRPLALPPAEVAAQLTRQLERFLAIATECGVPIHHVKPHGALYLQACGDPELAATVAGTIAGLLPGTMLYAPAGSGLQHAAIQAGLRPVAEAFADRRYRADGTLVPRSHPAAVLGDPEQALAQALRISRQGEVVTIDGTCIPMPARTLCVHGDGPETLTLLRRLREQLLADGWAIQPPTGGLSG